MATPIDINEVHRLVGAVAVGATKLELGLTDSVASLTRSPLTSIVVQGERGTTLIEMCRRLLDRGVGSSEEDEESGRSDRLQLISAMDTKTFKSVLKTCEILLRQRDDVVHSYWIANLAPGQLTGARTTRAKKYTRTWKIAELEVLCQGLESAADYLFVSTWNTSDSGMPRIKPRGDDVL